MGLQGQVDGCYVSFHDLGNTVCMCDCTGVCSLFEHWLKEGMFR